MTVIATAGHVDHGKSSIIRALTGIDPDRLAEEQRKGMTIDLGFAHVTTPSGTVLSFIDVPGHADFIRTMISGVSGVDIALLVIDAREGWKPQTEEHLGILEVLGVSQGLVALAKCDRVNDQDIAVQIEEINSRLALSSLIWHGIVPTSAHTGLGLDELVRVLTQLVENTTTDLSVGAPRLFVDRVFTMKGAGTVVTGTLDTSVLSANDALVVARTQQTARIRSMQTHGREVQTCDPGSRCAINIVGVHTEDVSRGDALIAPDSWLLTNVFDAQFSTLREIPSPVSHRGSFTLHIGSNVQSAKIRIINGEKIHSDSSGTMRVRFENSLPLRPGDKYLLRDTSTNSTLGGGVILDIDPINKISRSQPDGSVNSILSGRGFVHIKHAQLLTGAALEPMFGQWYACEEDIELLKNDLLSRLKNHSTIALSELQEYEKEMLSTLPGVVIDGDVARFSESDSLATHPLLHQIRAWGISGPSTQQLDRNTVRQLAQRGLIFEHDFIAFHADTLNELRPHLALLWAAQPSGFSVSHLRESLGITRKHAVPLAECLDKIGITRRVADLRVPGTKW